MNFLARHLKNSKYPRLEIGLNLLFTFVLTYAGTRFTPVNQVLSVNSWGGGTPSSTVMTAFATLRPWWWQHQPEAIRVTASGGIEPVVMIPRSQIMTTQGRVLPQRGIGYDALLGLVTAVRSLFSENVIYDFALMVRLQQFWLVLALTLIPVALYSVHPDFRSPKIFTLFNAVYLLLLLIKPNKTKFLSEGIVDSSLANPFALLSVGAFFLVIHGVKLQLKTDYLKIVGGSLFLSFCTMIRGEFLFIFLFGYLFFLTTLFLKEPITRKGFLLSFLLLFSFPISYGMTNKVIFDHFVPLRMQSGQNLLEPIGQYPNSYGIAYSDQWLANYLSQNKLEYTSFEADEFLTKKYIELFFQNPKLFFINFYKRLWYFSTQFSYFINFLTIPFILWGLIYFSRKDSRLVFVSLPLILAIGYLLFFGWTNNLLRLVSPAHFLINVFTCYLCIFLIIRRPAV